MIKKFLIILAVSVSIVSVFTLAPSVVFAREVPGTTGSSSDGNSSSSNGNSNNSSASADNSDSSNITNGTGGCELLLGLVPWYCGVKLEGVSSEKELSDNIWIALSNVLKDLVVIAAYLILGFVIYGGYLYIFSGGETAKVATGKKTLTNGFIGLAIVLLANIFVTSIRVALGANFTQNCFSTECVNPTEMVSEAIQWSVGICGLVAAAFVVYGGILYITSSGDSQKTQRAKQTILYALIGIAIVALAEIITAFVTNTINGAANNANSTGYNYQIIAKEIHEKNN